jgi:ANTAR domain/GAF domain
MIAPAVALAAAAAALVVDHDTVGTLSRFCAGCAEVAGAATVGIMLARASGSLEVMAASSHKAEELDLYEFQAGQGPCIDAFHTGAGVSCASAQQVRDRWPVFGAQATAAGVQAVEACPLLWRGFAIGAISAFFTSPGSLVDEERQVVQAFADIATVAVIQTSQPVVRDVAGITRAALSRRAVIEQAKGVLAAQTGLDMAGAFGRLLAMSDDSGRPLETLAREVIDTAIRHR